MTDLAEPTVEGVGSRRDPDPVAAVAENFIDLMRTFGRARQRLLQAATHDVEWSSHVVLRCVKSEGPLRAGAVADYLQSDPSTVSRQVAALVKDGLLERRADPEDGRASLLVTTRKAEEVLANHDRIRMAYFAEMLSGWSATDLHDFATLLDRFAQAYGSMNDEWITDRVGKTAGPAGSTH